MIDGWSGDAGVYDLAVTQGEPCFVSCPDGATPEGEPCDDTGATDTNGGCNSDPRVFDAIDCEETLCGQAWALDGIRDTDWFIQPADASDRAVVATLTAGFDGILFAFHFNVDCSSIVIPPTLDFSPCDPDQIQVVVPADNTAWWIVLPLEFDNIPCSDQPGPITNDYVLSINCSTDIPPTPAPSSAMPMATDSLTSPIC